MNFARKSVIYENPLGSFTCRKAGTWDILFYFLSEGRHIEDFPDGRKIQWVSVASMLTTRPPKPSKPLLYSPVPKPKSNEVKHHNGYFYVRSNLYLYIGI